MSNYVIKSWQANNSDTPNGGPAVRIEARAAGLLSWLLGVLNISPTIVFAVDERHIRFEEGSLAGSVTHLTPLENTCSTFYGFTKPWKEAVAVGFVVGTMFWFLLAIPGIILGVLYYYLNMTLTVGFTTKGGSSHAVSFKRSVIEGQKIDEAEAARVCAIIQRLVAARQG
jgi:hypothetical protein